MVIARKWFTAQTALVDVASNQVFPHAKSRNFLGGLLVEYKSGAQRALGQCRVGMIQPKRIYDIERLGFEVQEVVNNWSPYGVCSEVRVYVHPSKEITERCQPADMRSSEGKIVKVQTSGSGLSLALFRPGEEHIWWRDHGPYDPTT